MPVIEYVCSECGQPFELLVLYTSRMGEVTCPACHSKEVTKKISNFASKSPGGGSFSFGGSSSSSCDTGNV